MAAFLSRIDRFALDEDWQVQESLKYLTALRTLAPGALVEILDDDRSRIVDFTTPGGIIIPDVAETSVGPVGTALLDVWAAKLAMAMYREHIGVPLPLTGGVHAMWFLNNGLSQDAADHFLKILPDYNLLQQGERKHSRGQFEYRYNTDGKGIVATLSQFRANLHVFTISMADPASYGFPKAPMVATVFARPGELINRMPATPPAILRNPISKRGIPGLRTLK
jgi:hypothetical protein